jgi:hypothetical protein
MTTQEANGKTLPNQTYQYALEAAGHTGSGPLFARYVAGEYAAVWDELRALGGAVRDNDALLADATHVARETMRRCRFNVETLVEHLRYQYRHENYPDAPPFVPADPSQLKGIAEWERRVGPVPLSVCAWLEQVGAVNFLVYGRYREWDPLVFTDIEVRTTGVEGLFRQPEWPAGEVNWIDFSVDHIFKAGYGGGDPYAFVLPGTGADAEVDGTPYASWASGQLYFVPYLRFCFAWGGFPGDGRGGQIEKSQFGTVPDAERRKRLPPLDGLLPI